MKKPFTTSFELRFSDADPGGIMFFGNVYKVAHDTYENFIRHLGFDWHEWFQNPVWAVPIRHSSCEHLIPLSPGLAYEVAISLERVGDSSFTLKYDFQRATQKFCSVTLVHTFFNIKSRAKMQIPSNVRDRLQAYQVESLDAQ
jgi:acyl-CoA thioesterase FadM